MEVQVGDALALGIHGGLSRGRGPGRGLGDLGAEVVEDPNKQIALEDAQAQNPAAQGPLQGVDTMKSV